MASSEIKQLKLHLENWIFSQAVCEHRTVQAKEGKLICANSSGLLCCLIQLYNRFFAAGNRRLLIADIQQTRQAERARYAYFLQERRRYPPLLGFHLK